MNKTGLFLYQNFMAAKKRTLSPDTIIAISATIVSACALIITIYQTSLMREQQLKTVWPYLITSEMVDENQKMSIIITNNGIGPAIVDSVRIEYKGQSYKSYVEVVKQISKELNRGEYGLRWSHNSISKGSVIQSGNGSEWITVNGEEDNKIFAERMRDVKSYIYYRSIYDEKWCSQYHVSDKSVIEI